MRAAILFLPIAIISSVVVFALPTPVPVPERTTPEEREQFRSAFYRLMFAGASIGLLRRLALNAAFMRSSGLKYLPLSGLMDAASVGGTAGVGASILAFPETARGVTADKVEGAANELAKALGEGTWSENVRAKADNIADRIGSEDEPQSQTEPPKSQNPAEDAPVEQQPPSDTKSENPAMKGESSDS